MLRKIIHIDEEKCNGCGICAEACHEGAIEMIDGKAKLVRENFCDGLGDCLPACPTGAITFEEREAPAYDEAAVKRSQEEKNTREDRNIQDEIRRKMMELRQGGGCPGSRMMELGANRKEPEETANAQTANVQTANVRTANVRTEPARPVSRLNQWPCQIKLLPVQAPFFDGARLLIAADCTAYAYANMHEDFMKGRITLIGCPKLDEGDYTEKLTAIIRENDIKSVTVVRMEVPCCGGLQRAAENALRASGKFIPWQIVTISRDGRILDE